MRIGASAGQVCGAPHFHSRNAVQVKDKQAGWRMLALRVVTITSPALKSKADSA